MQEERELKWAYGSFEAIDEAARMRQRVVERGSCWSCDKAPKTLSHCAGCGVSRYCNKACQAADWARIHKRLCKPLKADRADSAEGDALVAKLQLANQIARWSTRSLALLFQLAAHCVDNDPHIAQTYNTYLYVRPAAAVSGLQAKLVAAYAVPMERDESAYETDYHYKTKSPEQDEVRQLSIVKPGVHRIFIAECVKGQDGQLYHAFQMPIAGIQRTKKPHELTFDFMMHAFEAGVPSLKHVGAALGANMVDINGLYDPSKQPKLPDATAVGIWNGKLGIFERRDGKARWSDSQPFSGERKWIEVPADSF